MILAISAPVASAQSGGPTGFATALGTVFAGVGLGCFFEPADGFDIAVGAPDRVAVAEGVLPACGSAMRSTPDVSSEGKTFRRIRKVPTMRPVTTMRPNTETTRLPEDCLGPEPPLIRGTP